MQWYDCVKSPPATEGEYEVLVLDYDIDQGEQWRESHGKYKDGKWTLWKDGYGWYDVSEIGFKPYYWCALPPYPPLPNAEPLCESFCYNYCLSQKNIPRCFCEGNKNKCECKEN